MTVQYEQLQDGPQTGITKYQLNPEERIEVRSITVTGSTGDKNTPGRYTTVYYLEGNEDEAVKKFVEANRDQLARIDFSKKQNAVLASLPRYLYDGVLHELGVRSITKLETVVLETRRDGTQWVIDRELYERFPNRRYTVNKSAKIPPTSSARRIYEQLGPVLTETALRETGITGRVRHVLEYYLSAREYDCVQVDTEKGDLAVKKRSPPASFVSERDLVQTYTVYDDPWGVTEDYRQVQQLAREDASRGIAGIARDVGLEPWKVRSWVIDEKEPYTIKALKRANSRGWVNVRASSEVFDGLNRLVAWVFSGGGISTDTFEPSFSIDNADRLSAITQALDAVGVDHRVIRESTPGKGPEVRLGESASLLGRVLHVLGAPIGVKADHASLSLPAYLYAVSPEHRLVFARTYLQNRGVPLAGSQSSWREIGEARSPAYLYALRDFFELVSGERVTVNPENRKVYLSDNAVHALNTDQV